MNFSHEMLLFCVVVNLFLIYQKQQARRLSRVESKRFAAHALDGHVVISNQLGSLKKPARRCAHLPSWLLMRCGRIKDRSALTAVQHLKKERKRMEEEEKEEEDGVEEWVGG